MSLQILYVWILDCQMDKLILFEVISNIRLGRSSLSCSPKTKKIHNLQFYMYHYRKQRKALNPRILVEVVFCLRK